ncbi:MliC family protein [Microbulbifer bruguierae]|uniref:MliC family protein n=1 Tax=Microbulbifer bruguierae TaxID=3029061 RepID=A0ABY8NEU4_9GAMM|nr:MliC family protein [Microbulbifer bruguierae]WGL16939.1 MliC family protein [Microbulbifer bruguierae]
MARWVLVIMVMSLAVYGCEKNPQAGSETPPDSQHSTREKSAKDTGTKDKSIGVNTISGNAGADDTSTAPASSNFNPSYDCAAARVSSIEKMICADESLSELDQKMASVYKAAGETEKARQDRYFKAYQRGWIKGRNECWKADDKRQCVVESYRRRILELQVGYGLLPAAGSATFLCDGAPLTVTYYDTEPRAALAEYKEDESIMVLEPTASGTRYRGRNESLWEHQTEATVVWGYGASEMRCKLRS